MSGKVAPAAPEVAPAATPPAPGEAATPPAPGEAATVGDLLAETRWWLDREPGGFGRSAGVEAALARHPAGAAAARRLHRARPCVDRLAMAETAALVRGGRVDAEQALFGAGFLGGLGFRMGLFWAAVAVACLGAAAWCWAGLLLGRPSFYADAARTATFREAQRMCARTETLARAGGALPALPDARSAARFEPVLAEVGECWLGYYAAADSLWRSLDGAVAAPAVDAVLDDDEEAEEEEGTTRCAYASKRGFAAGLGDCRAERRVVCQRLAAHDDAPFLLAVFVGVGVPAGLRAYAIFDDDPRGAFYSFVALAACTGATLGALGFYRAVAQASAPALLLVALGVALCGIAVLLVRRAIWVATRAFAALMVAMGAAMVAAGPLWWGFFAIGPPFVALGVAVARARTRVLAGAWRVVAADYAAYCGAWRKTVAGDADAAGGLAALDAALRAPAVEHAGTRDRDAVAARLAERAVAHAAVARTWHGPLSGRPAPRPRPYQRCADLGVLFGQAARLDAYFQAAVAGWAAAAGGAPADPGVKRRARAVEKLWRSYDGDAARCVDLVRASITCATLAGVARCAAVVRADDRVAVLRSKNLFSESHDARASAGFRHVALNLVLVDDVTRALGVDHHVAELQFTVAAIDALKRGRGAGGHARYVQFRTLRAE